MPGLLITTNAQILENLGICLAFITILMNLYLGFDCGTSGLRAVLIDDSGTLEHQFSYSLELATIPKTHLATSWKVALWQLIEQIPQKLRPKFGNCP